MKAEDLTTLLETGEKTPEEICLILYTMSILGQRWNWLSREPARMSAASCDPEYTAEDDKQTR